MESTGLPNNNPENKGVAKTIILSFSLLLGLCVLGYFIFQGLKTFSDKDRVVTVNGLAEMDMKATSASIVRTVELLALPSGSSPTRKPNNSAACAK